MARGGLRFQWYAPLLGVAGFLVLLAVGWTVDAARARGNVQRNVTVAEFDVGGMSKDDLRAQIADIATRFAATQVTVTAVDPAGGPPKQFTATAADVGLAVDQAATTTLALDANRTGLSPAAWVRTFTRDAEITPVVELIEPKAREAAGTFDGSARAAAVEPKIELRDGALIAVEGTTGVALDGESVVAALRPVRYTRTPIAVQAALVQVAPARDIAAIQIYVDQVNFLTAEPLPVKAGAASIDISTEMLRSWVVVTDDGSLDMRFDDALVNLQLAETLASGGTAPVDASLAMEGDPLGPVIHGGTDGLTCCAPEAAGIVLEAVKLRANAPLDGPVDLPMNVQPPAVTRQSIEALGIVQPVASFTTNHACCQSRVQNIHRMADLLQGYLIRPGEMLSVNGFVGERTVEKGFVPGGAIVDGEFDEQVGGGVSQYATTLFNAAWFAGLDYGEYGSHSIYISRYPYGREATANFPHPDLQVQNNLPYGVLIQNSYTDTSITVTIWSTQVFASVEQTDQEERPVGEACTDVETFRTKSFLDGTTAVDSTKARYRPEGLKCDGTPSATTAPQGFVGEAAEQRGRPGPRIR